MKTAFAPAGKCTTFLALILGLLVSVGAVRALDYVDLVGLYDNGVPEETILNILRQGGGVTITPAQESELRAKGVSENVIVLARSTAAYPEPAVATTAQPVPAVVQVQRPVASGPAEGTPVVPLSISTVAAYPSLYAKEGWLSVSNQDYEAYFLNVDRGSKRIFISRVPNGGFEVAAGENIVINTRKETYKMYGDSGIKLEVKVREGETTRLQLVPFGVVGNSGLQGIVQDRERVRNEILFNNYTPPPAVVVVPERPVVVVEPPVRYYYPSHRPYYRHRPGWGGSFYSW